MITAKCNEKKTDEPLAERLNCDFSNQFERRLRSLRRNAQRTSPLTSVKQPANGNHPTHTATESRAETAPRDLVKVDDFDRYFDEAKLTDKQREAASLRWEYGLPVAEIAAKLNLHRTSVDGRIVGAQRKMNAVSGLQQRMRKQFRNE